MAELDCRIIAIFTLALSLVFLGSVIFFRHHQHIHSLTGDNYHRDRVHRSSQEQTELSDDVDGEDEREIKCLTVSDNPSETHISEVCLQCLCETVTECKPAICNDLPCGFFKISKGYWLDAGAPILEGTMQNSRYWQCINNPYCAARTITGYVSRYIHDCNKDGVINCNDIMQLHVLGPTGCRLNKEIDNKFKSRYDSCMRNMVGKL